MRSPRFFPALIAALLATTPALAGVVDSPLPLLSGKKPIHVFTVPGVTHVWGLGTVFMCASTEKTNNVTVGIEVFQYDGVPLNDLTAGNGVGTLAPANTFTFTTAFLGSDIAAFVQDITVDLGEEAQHATARILATSKNIVCTAMLVSVAGQPPASMTTLPVIAKLKQDGD